MSVERFSYHRAVAPTMWVLVAVAAVELAVTHLLVAALIGRVAAIILSIVTLAAIGWMVAAIAAMRSLPVELDDRCLVMRAGRIKRIDVPVASIAGFRRTFDATTLKDPETLKLSLIAYPNVIVDIDPPIRRRRTIRAIAHRLDDPLAFTRAIERLVAGR